MKYDFTLTCEQQRLVEQNLVLVNRVIARYIQTNERICGLGYEDLYQEGCIALCRAASTYDGVSAQFCTYAVTVIRNHLIDCCRAVGARLRNLPSVSLDIDPSEDEGILYVPEPSVIDGTDELIDHLDTARFLESCKARYSGVARLGVEALDLKIKGYTSTDIARLYNVKPGHVGAWISRAAQKIRKDLASDVENGIALS